MILLALIAKMTACSGILYGYYWLFLRNKRFHHYNRFYLLAATGVSIVIPLIKIPIFFEPVTLGGQIVNKSIDIISVNRWEDEFVDKGSSNSLVSWVTMQTGLLVLYGMGVIFLLYVLGRSLIYIHHLSKKYSYEYINALKLYNTAEPGTPFSFFRSIFWNISLDLNSKEGEQILRHELFHVKQRHSADILFLELVSIFFWFNPFFHLIKKETKAIHEFLADQHSVSENNQHDYAELLILQSIHAKKSSLPNYFFQTHIKRRIAMITQFKTKKYNYWSRLFVLPLALFLFCAIALYAQNRGPSQVKKEMNSLTWQRATESITVLVDAGHGGKDAGARNDGGLQEKDLALSIARKIKENAPAYNINAIMTREEDVFPTLKERSELAKAVKADMVISVHVAASDPSTQTGNGFDIFITNRNQQTIGQSKLLGQSIATQINTLYTVGPIKQRKENGIWILDAVTCPAVLIECGYITNKKDVEFISKPENQEKIAKSILEGIVDYHSGNRIKNLGDTIPANKRIKDSIQLKETQLKQEITQRKLAEDRTIQNEQKALIQKHQEMELAQRKMAEGGYIDIQNEQKALIQKQQEMELNQRKMAEGRYIDIQNEQKALIQKQQEMELNQRKIAEQKLLENEKKNSPAQEKQKPGNPEPNKKSSKPQPAQSQEKK